MSYVAFEIVTVLLLVTVSYPTASTLYHTVTAPAVAFVISIGES